MSCLDFYDQWRLNNKSIPNEALFADVNFLMQVYNWAIDEELTEFKEYLEVALCAYFSKLIWQRYNK